MLVRNCPNDYRCLVTTENSSDALKLLENLCHDLVTMGPDGLSRTILFSNLVQCLVALLARHARAVSSTECIAGPNMSNAGDGHHGGCGSSSISNSISRGCGGDATDDESVGDGSDCSSGSESWWDCGGDSGDADLPGVATQPGDADPGADQDQDQNHGAVFWRLVMLACRIVALIPEGRQALVSSGALLPLLSMFVSRLETVEGPVEGSALKDAGGLAELDSLFEVLDGEVPAGCGTVPQRAEQHLDNPGETPPAAKRRKVGICKSEGVANHAEPLSVMAWTMASLSMTAAKASGVRGSTHATGPSCSGCTANTTMGTAVIGLDKSVAAAAVHPPQLGVGNLGKNGDSDEATVSPCGEAHVQPSNPHVRHPHGHTKSLLMSLHSPPLAENLKLLLDLMLDEQAAAARPCRNVSSAPAPADEGDPVHAQSVGCCCSSDRGGDGSGDGAPSTGTMTGIHSLLQQQLRKQHHCEGGLEGKQEVKRPVSRKQAAAALPVVQKSWRAAREAAVAAEVAAHRGKSPSVAAVPSPQPGQPPPPEVLRDLACLVMLLADAAMGAQFANTEGKAAAWGEERHEATGGEGGFRASSGPAAFGVAWGVGVPAGNVHVGDGGGGSGSGSSGRPGGSSSLSSTCPSRSLLQPTEWLRLLVKHWETQPLRLTQTRRCPQPRRHRGAGDFRQPTSGPANALPAGHYARYPDAMEAGVLPLKPLLDASTSSELGCRPIYDHEVGDQDDGDYSSSYMPSLTTRSVMQELLPASCHCPLMDTPDRQLLPYIRRVRTNLLPYMVAHEDVDLVRSGSERFVAAAAGTAAAAGIPIANATESAGSLVSAGDAAAAMAAPAADQPSTPPPVVAPNAVTVKDCGTAMRGGFTMVLRAAGARSAKICAVQDELESLIGLPTGANIYCTPPGNQGLAAHYDDHCVLVLQLQGAKEWLLQPPRLLPAQMLPLSYCPRLLLAPLQAIAVPDEPEILAPMGPEEGTEPALPGWAVTAKAPGMAMAAAGSPPAPSRIADREGATAKMAEPAAVTTRVVLQPGNLLYVPRGWGHQAVAVAGAAWTPVQNVWSDDRSNGNGGGRASGSDPVGTAAEGALPSGVSLHVTFGFEVEALFTWQAVAHCILALVAAERRQRRQRATWEADQVQEAHKKKHQQRRECSGGAEPGWPIRDSQYGDQAEVTATYPAQGRPLDTTLAAQVLLHAWLVRTTFSANTWPLLLLRKAAPLTVLARLGSCSQLQQPLKDITTTATVTAVADAVRCKCQPCRPSPPAGRPNAATRKGPVSAASPEVRAEAPTAVASAPREAGEAAHETAAPRVMGVGSATGGLQEPGREQQGLKTMAAVALLQNFQGCLQWREVGEKGPEPPPPLQQRKGVQAAALAEQPLVKPGLPVLISRGQVRFSGADVGTCSGSGIKEEDLPNVGASGDMLEGSNGVVMDSDTDIDRHLPCDLPASVSAGLSGGAPLEAEPLTVIALARRLMQLLHQQWQQQQQQDEDVEQHGATAQGQTKRGHGKLVDTIGGALRRATEELECHMLGVSAGRCSLAQGQGQGQEQGTGLKSSVAAAQAAARRATVDTAAGMAPHVSCGPYDAPYWLEWTTELLSKAGHCMHSCTGVLGDCALGGVDTVADGRVLCGRGGSNISFNRRDPGHGVELHQGDSAGGHEDEYRDALGSLDAVEVCNAVIRAMGCGGGSTAVDTSSGSVEDTNPWIQSVLQEAEGLLAAASSCGEEVAQCVVALVAIDQRDCLRARLRARHALLALHAED